jgi:hypothetical protein
MKSLRKQSGQLLIIYLTTLFVGGSTLTLGVLATGQPVKELEKNVKAHVVDKERQQQALLLLGQWQDEGKALKKEYQKQRDSLLELLKQHDADRLAFESAVDKILKMDQKTSTRMLDIQYGLRDTLTQEEWSKVF